MPQALAIELPLIFARTDEAIRQSARRIDATEAKVIVYAQRAAGQKRTSRALLDRIRAAH